MRLKLFILLAVLFAVVVSIPTVVSATIISIGEPIPENSWAQRFQEYGVGNFDFMEAFMISSGDAFEAPGFSNFNNVSWSGTFHRSDYITATGTVLNSLYFDVKFIGNASNPLTFDFLAWQGEPVFSEGNLVSGTLREKAHVVWTGSAWNITSSVTYGDDVAEHDRGDISPTTPVPEPTTLLLLGTGLVGLALFRKILKREVN